MNPAPLNQAILSHAETNVAFARGACAAELSQQLQAEVREHAWQFIGGKTNPGAERALAERITGQTPADDVVEQLNSFLEGEEAPIGFLFAVSLACGKLPRWTFTDCTDDDVQNELRKYIAPTP